MIELIKLANIYLNHFPKHEKYALCGQIRNSMYDIYNLITECSKRYYKKTTITNLDVKHQQLRMQIYLAYELGYFKFKDGKTAKKSPEDLEIHRYSAISKLVDEIGKMIGSWIKKLKEQNTFK